MSILEKYNYYLETKSIRQVAKRFKACTKTLSRDFKSHGYEYPISSRTYTLDETYFDNIDSPGKAYVLGFIFADGCLYIREKYVNSKEYSLSIRLVESDIEVLEYIKKQLGSSHKIAWADYKKFISVNGKEYIRKPQVCLSISNNYLGKSLNKFIGRNKTYDLNFPALSLDLYPHFIRGFFDGDGSICYRQKSTVLKNKTYTYLGVLVSFTIKDYKFAKSLFDFIKNLGLSVHLNYSKSKCVYTVAISDSKSASKFYNYLYNDSKNQFQLNRKYIKYSSFMEKSIKITM